MTSVFQDNVNLIAHTPTVSDRSDFKNTIHAYIEVTYSQTRKEEMRAANEENCMLLISLLVHKLQRMGATNVTEWTPKNKHRFADIVIEFDVDDEGKLEPVVEALKDISDSSVEKMELFVELV